jgi:hypothetical protein
MLAVFYPLVCLLIGTVSSQTIKAQEVFQSPLMDWIQEKRPLPLLLDVPCPGCKVAVKTLVITDQIVRPLKSSQASTVILTGKVLNEDIPTGHTASVKLTMHSTGETYGYFLTENDMRYVEPAKRRGVHSDPSEWLIYDFEESTAEDDAVHIDHVSESSSFEKRSDEEAHEFSKRNRYETNIFNGAERVCTLAIIVDYNVYKTLGQNTFDFFADIVSEMSEQYEDQLGMRVDLARMHIINVGNHPLASINSDPLFGLQMILERGLVENFDAANYCAVQYIMNESPYRDVTGRAFIEGVCSGASKNVGAIAFAGRPRRHILRTMMHELGHTVGSEHDPSSCVSDPATAYLMFTQAIPSSPNYMNFSPCSLNQISSRIRSSGNSHCLKSTITPGYSLTDEREDPKKVAPKPATPVKKPTSPTSAYPTTPTTKSPQAPRKTSTSTKKKAKSSSLSSSASSSHTSFGVLLSIAFMQLLF